MAHKWNKLKNAEIFGNRGKYLKADFSYKLRILKSYMFETRKKGDMFIVDFEVLKSNCPDIPKGDKRNWCQMMNSDSAMGNIKAFLFALYGIDQDDEDLVEQFEDKLEEIMEEAGDEKWERKKEEDHPFYDMTIAVETVEVPTQAGGTFTVHKWEAWEQ